LTGHDLRVEGSRKDEEKKEEEKKKGFIGIA
jgi:hypothetical protein